MRFLPIAAGAVLGFLYYKFIGCNSGSCPITSDPMISTAYGGVMGALLSFSDKKKLASEENYSEKKEQ